MGRQKAGTRHGPSHSTTILIFPLRGGGGGGDTLIILELRNCANQLTGTGFRREETRKPPFPPSTTSNSLMGCIVTGCEAFGSPDLQPLKNREEEAGLVA